MEEYNKKKNDKKEPDGLIEIFTLAKDGKVKSLTLLGAFVMGFVILFAYFLVQNLLTIAFEGWFPNLSRSWLNALDIGVPTLLCTAVFCLTSRLLKNKWLLPLGYLTALLVILIVLVYMLVTYPADIRAAILPVVIWIFLVPVAFGFAALLLCTRLASKRRAGGR